MENFITRAALISDAEAIAQVQYQGWQDTYSHIFPASYLSRMPVRVNRWKEILSAPSSEKFNEVLVSPENLIIGFVSGGACRAGELKTDGEIYSLYLLKQYHNKGLGKQLFMHAVKKLSEASHKSFCVFVLTQNPSIGFYRKFNPDMQIQVKYKQEGIEYDEAGLGWSDIRNAAT